VRALLLALAALLAAAVCAPAVCATPAGAQTLPGLTTGFTDGVFESPSPSLRDQWLAQAVNERAGVVRLGLSWRSVEPTAPTSETLASDPSWPGYTWSVPDAAVTDAVAHGLVVQLSLTGGAPSWAEGPGRPASATPGSWRPDPAAYGAFAHAAAVRYSGAYTPPGASAPLPRVRYWQAWNEPNLSIYLAPQWRKAGRGWAPESPAVYRALLNAFYGAVKSVQPDALVLSAGTAPYGDLPGGERMPPAQFDRNLFCLSESGLRPLPCPGPARFDILDHHPYSVQGPFFRAFNRDDVAIADMAKLIVPLRRAERLRLVGGARRHQVWVTEVAWDSSPPNPRGVPVATQARWLEQTLQLLWREGVSTVLWYLIVDKPAIFTNGDEFASAGVYLLDGRPKPSATAFRFPFVVNRLGRSRAIAWGREPVPGALVTIEQNVHGAWRVLRTLKPGPSGVFQVRLRVSRGALLRARDGDQLSLAWRVG
jgi:hypothetical protein